MKQLRLVTRQSPLAMWQAVTVQTKIQKAFPDLDVKLIGVVTDGDRWLDRPLYELGGKSLFVKALEEAILEGRADIAVHSMKDMPAVLPDGLCLATVLERADARDVWVSNRYPNMADMPSDARVGTGSLRRSAQFLRRYPKVQIVPLRGNVGTRLEKLESEHLDGILLAAAGLDRLGYADRIASHLPVDWMLPAIGQGIMGVECREDDQETRAILAALEHRPSLRCVLAERAVNAALGGSCHSPIGGHATIDDGELSIRARVLSRDGLQCIDAQAKGQPKRAQEIGHALGQALLAQGAGRLLED